LRGDSADDRWKRMGMKEQEIFVIVRVEYDYYRFQENLAASTDIEEARKLAVKFSEERIGWSSIFPIIESEKESLNMNEKEIRHIYIEKFPKEEET